MSADNYSVAGRYRTVRKNLDALGYKQALSIDSLPLIELLLVDLAQTKESLKHFQSLAKDNIEACSQLQLAVDPYKCDNAKLVQECNQLHLELIEAKEASQKQSNEYKKKIRKLENEYSDLQLSFSKNLQRIKQLEVESSNKSKKILELQGKCCKPIVNNVNLATKKRTCYPLRRPTLETEPLPRASTSSVSFSSRKVEPYIVDFVSKADHRISCLNNEVIKLKEELFISHENVQTLKSQLNTKEKEISRLRTMLEGGRPCTSINKDHCCIRSEKMNGFHRYSHEDELANLEEAKMKLEQQLKEALNKLHDAMAQAMKLAERNEELERELKDVDRLALRVEADCNSTVKENNRRVCRLQEKLEDVMIQVHVLESELTVQRREAQELRADLEACRLEKTSVQRTLESTLEEKKQMTDKINNLTMIASRNQDQSSNRHEVGSHSKQSPKRCACAKDIAGDSSRSNTADSLIREKNIIIDSLQNTIKRLESELDRGKIECANLSDQYRQDTGKEHDSLWSEICELRAQLSEKEHAISKLLREKKEVCQEKFNLENKLLMYQNQQRSSSPCNHCRCGASPSNERRSSSMSNKIEKLERDRDEAKADVERLISERDALRERLKGSRRAAISGLDEQIEDFKEELKRTKQELSEQRTQYFQLRTLQDQTDQALGDVQGQLERCENELSSALDRNKNLEQQQLQLDNQIMELRQEINCHRSTMAQLDHEKDQLLMDLDDKTEKIAALERELDFKDKQIHTMEQQIRDMTHTKEFIQIYFLQVQDFTYRKKE
ncbi:centrosomal protein of 135 kDa [Phymastichus coffea]|uniref:centrosomal protein of 135 kDa n=1 Tax=Phymastichus coffea TaxID=108790 RepID=UPI00273C2098|nr:centrosomal protein of 135 kDa [Phymastichus coffea]